MDWYDPIERTMQDILESIQDNRKRYAYHLKRKEKSRYPDIHQQFMTLIELEVENEKNQLRRILCGKL